MRLVCKYCGYCVEYENGRGWFPEYANELRQWTVVRRRRIRNQKIQVMNIMNRKHVRGVVWILKKTMTVITVVMNVDMTI